jgi:hypothetical protein
MDGPNIVFFHVGDETIFPIVMVRSVRANNPGAHIIQVTDRVSPDVAGVDEIVRFDGDSSHPMGFRLECYARLPTRVPTFFLDTDMICVQPIDPAAALEGNSAAVCLREYLKDLPLDTGAMGVDLSEHRGRTLGDVYPYVGCVTAAGDPKFWNSCLDELRRLPAKFWHWFGDQEALRNVVNGGAHKVGWLPESIYACLVDVEIDPTKNPKICHFKGPARKRLMLQCAVQAGFLDAREPLAGGYHIEG